MDRRKLLLGAGVTLIAAGVAAGVRIPFFYLRSYFVGQHLTRVATAFVTNHNPENQVTRKQFGAQTDNHTVGTPAPVTPPQMVSTIPLASPKGHSLFGLLEIPRLQLKAPVVEGTNDTVLNVAIGHLGSSSMPGQPGLAVLAAHNATWFRHINQLQTGDAISVLLKGWVYHYVVTHHEVVHTGTSLANSAASILVLESCYPLDALYLTPERYLIFAKLTRVSPAAGATQVASSGGGIAAGGASFNHSESQTQIRAKVPSDMAAEGLLLHQNSLPLGTIQYNGHPSTAFTQSAIPLEVTNTMVQLFEAYLHAASLKRTADLDSLYPAGASRGQTDDPLFGVPLSSVAFLQPLSFRLDIGKGDRLQSIKAETTMHIKGESVICHFTAQPMEQPSQTGSTIWIQLTNVSFDSQLKTP